MRPFAVEIRTSQAKKAGHPSNLYIVAGESIAYQYAWPIMQAIGAKNVTTPDPNATQCEVVSGKARNSVMYLKPTTTPITGMLPRPKVEDDWVLQPNGLWQYGGVSRLS